MIPTSFDSHQVLALAQLIISQHRRSLDFCVLVLRHLEISTRENVWVFEQDLLNPDGMKASRIPASVLAWRLLMVVRYSVVYMASH
jgi:hypothetical protein